MCILHNIATITGIASTTATACAWANVTGVKIVGDVEQKLAYSCHHYY